jgi:hypothetical protein
MPVITEKGKKNILAVDSAVFKDECSFLLFHDDRDHSTGSISIQECNFIASNPILKVYKLSEWHFFTTELHVSKLIFRIRKISETVFDGWPLASLCVFFSAKFV